MIKFIKNNRVIILGIFCIIFLILFFGIAVIKIQKRSYQKLIEHNQSEKLFQIEKSFISYNSNVNNKLLSTERFVNILIRNGSVITENENDTLFIEAVSDDNNIPRKFKISELRLNNIPINSNLKEIDEITYASNAFIAIWQKTENGFVKIATNEPGNSIEPVSRYLNDSTDVIKQMLSGNRTSVKIISEYDSKRIKSVPIYINGKIKAFIQIIVIEYPYSVFSQIFSLKDDDIILFSESGDIIYAAISSENEKLNMQDFKQNTFNKSKVSKIYLGNKILYYKYIIGYKVFAGSILSKGSLSSGIKRDILFTWIFIIVSSVILSTVFVLYYHRNIKNTEFIIGEIEAVLYDQNKIQKFNTDREKLRSIVADLKLYDEDIRNFAVSLSEDKLNNTFSFLSDKNETAIALKNIKDKISSVSIENERKRTEERQRLKLNEGSAVITGLLQHVSDLNELSFNIIKNTADFLDIQLGGMFILNASDPDHPVMEMIASYAYDKKRFAGKRIPLNEGLIGRAYLERESIYMTELPENYTLIESGFGEGKPKSLLIVPLIFNNEVQAVIELASIHTIEDYKIKFIEEIGENIASTILNLKQSKQTEELLNRTRIQSKEIEEQRKTLEEKINTHRKQNRNLDKEILQLIEIIESIKAITYMVEFDLKGSIIDVSRKTLNVLGIKKEDIITKHHRDIVADENYDENYKTFWTELLDNKTQILEEKIVFFDKEIIMTQNYVPIRNVRRKIYRVLSIGTILN